MYFLNANLWISIKFSLKFVCKGPIDDIYQRWFRQWLGAGQRQAIILLYIVFVSVCTSSKQNSHIFGHVNITLTSIILVSQITGKITGKYGQRAQFGITTMWWYTTVKQGKAKLCKLYITSHIMVVLWLTKTLIEHTLLYASLVASFSTRYACLIFLLCCFVHHKTTMYFIYYCIQQWLMLNNQ